MAPIGPRAKHLLEQFIAYNLEVSAKLKQFQADLVEMGWPEPEAWAQARRLERRILGPLLDYAEGALPVEEKVDELIRMRLDELEGGPTD